MQVVQGESEQADDFGDKFGKLKQIKSDSSIILLDAYPPPPPRPPVDAAMPMPMKRTSHGAEYRAASCPVQILCLLCAAYSCIPTAKAKYVKAVCLSSEHSTNDCALEKHVQLPELEWCAAFQTQGIECLALL